jgi:hypothetical protein
MRLSSARALSVGLVPLAMVAHMLGFAGAAQASSTVADRVAAVSTSTFEKNSQGLKEALAEELGQVATADPGPRRLADVADTASWYVDGARYGNDVDGKQAYLYDQQLVSYLDSSIQKSTVAATRDSLAAGMVDLLMAGRLTAETVVTDATTVLSGDPGDLDPVVDPQARKAAAVDLDAAERALAKAHESLAKGLPVAAETHFGLAWRHATAVLDELDITYAGDRDSDGIPDRAELVVGGSPLLKDTDGDGLLDGFEFDALAVLALNDRDTDDDGIQDGAENHDSDALAATQEQSAGTSPVNPDTDADGLRDGAEAAEGADPTVPDTDRDGLLDGAELRAGLDPTRQDTDGDGVQDGDEVLTVEVTGPAGASARVTGSGNSALSARIAEVSGDDRNGVASQVGPAMEFESPGHGMVQAEITLPYESTSFTAEEAAERLRVFWLDESVNAWVPAGGNQQVDTGNRAVTVTVSHFSTYAVFDIVNWNQTWTAKENPCRTRSGGGGDDVVFLDLALSIDSSSSMAWNDPQGLRKQAARNFVDALLPEDRAAVVDFDNSARVLQGLTTNKEAVKQAIGRIDASGGTNIGAGVGVANDVLIANDDLDRGRVMILLTDGDGSWNPAYLTEAKQNYITIYTIGLGTGVNGTLLRTIASETGGQFYQVATADELPEVFRRIGDDTGGDEGVTKDSDEDGLNDCVEIQGAYSPSTQQRYTSDPFDADTDGDGMKDGEEVQLFPADHGIPPASDIFWVLSDPSLADTDGDGLEDPSEDDAGTSEWRDDSDSDGLSDYEEVEWLTDPHSSDTDGDGISDGQEAASLAEGFSPVVFDDPMTADEWASEFAKGAALGDAAEGDTIPYLLGSLASSATSTIPVIGWIVGAVLDVRDTIGNLVRGEFVGAGLSLVGVVPYVGDAANIAGKVLKFLSRNATLVDDVLAAIAKLDDIPASVRADVLRRVESAFSQLKDAGVSDDAILKLARSRQGVQHVTDAMRRVGVTVGARIDFATSWRAAENAVAGTLSAGVKNTHQYVRIPGYTVGRYVDVVDGRDVAHEVKSGFVKLQSSISRQIEKDALMVADPQNPIQGVVWHFVASNTSGSLGADPRVLDLLDEAGIPYVIHLP